MEESKKIVARPGAQAHPLQSGLNTAVDNSVKVPLNKAGQAPYTSSALPASSPLGHCSAAASKSPMYQVPISKEKPPSGSSGVPSSYTGRVSTLSTLPQGDRPQVTVGGTNGHSYTSPIQGNYIISTIIYILRGASWSRCRYLGVTKKVHDQLWFTNIGSIYMDFT